MQKKSLLGLSGKKNGFLENRIIRVPLYINKQVEAKWDDGLNPFMRFVA